MRFTTIDFKMNNGRGALRASNVPVIDSFQIFGPSSAPALVDVRVEWEATGPAVARGSGNAVSPTDPAAFLGDISPALSRVMVTGAELGFEFVGSATTAQTYAQIGTVRNGVYL
jgi:hypothetical protein